MASATDWIDPPWQLTHEATSVAEDGLTVAGLFLRRAERDPHRIAYRKKHGGRWAGTSWQQMREKSEAFAAWLIANGVEAGDKVAIVGSTRSEWAVSDIGGQLAGAVTLGAYPTLTAEQLAYILDHSDTKVVVLEGEADLAKVLSQRDALPKLEKIVVWDENATEGVTLWNDALQTQVDNAALQKRQDAIDPDATAIIVYTSGTTGPPKGAMISHRNVMTVLASQTENAPFDKEDVSFSFLPMAHVAERVLGFYGRIDVGISTYYATSIPKVLEEVQEARPTLFGSVPRIFEKAYAKILGRVSTAPPLRQRIFRWAERVGREMVSAWQEGKSVSPGLVLQYRIADRLVFSKIREVFGGRVRYFVTGAAPIAPEILEFFWAAGFRIYEVYGMTEATVVTHANRPGEVRLGSVGRALSYVEHRIAEDGEILVKGGMVFQGYYKNPEATAETIRDGWLHTGDIGEIDADGFLSIKDRKKHIIITAGGKNLTPANIENEIKASDPLISQAHVHGDRRKYLVALVTIGAAEAMAWGAAEGVISQADADGVLAELAADPLAQPESLPALMEAITAHEHLQTKVTEAIRHANENLARVETIKKAFVLDRELSVEHDELTPTLKVKRKNVEAKFADTFERLYAEESFGLKII
ncbi:MAG: long-chain fatty acid--CoA ligase [Myxococcota bacterium]